MLKMRWKDEEIIKPFNKRRKYITSSEKLTTGQQGDDYPIGILPHQKKIWDKISQRRTN